MVHNIQLHKVLNVSFLIFTYFFQQIHLATLDTQYTIGNAGPTVTTQITCPFSGTRYQLGDSWFRRLDTHDMAYCVACSCGEKGKSNCISKPCVTILTLCEEANDLTAFEKGCCQQCQETEHTKRVEVHAKSPIDMESMPSSYTSTRSPTTTTCLHNGRIYYDGQVFASNSSGIHKTSDNQCVQCICQNGLVLCRLKTCFINDCDDLKAKQRDGLNEDCCLMREYCQEKPISDEDSYKKSHLVTFFGDSSDGADFDSSSSKTHHDHKDVQHQDDHSHCKSGGKIHSNGAKWHPIIGPFGQMDCVICTCNSGNVECSRINCPTEVNNKLACDQPRRITGQCCLSCSHSSPQENGNNEEDRMIDTAIVTETTMKEGHEIGTKSGFVHTHLHAHRREESQDRIKGSVSTSHSFGRESVSKKKLDENVICLGVKSDTIVYRSHAQNGISGYYQYAFQTIGTNMSTHLYSFSVKDGRVADFSEQRLSLEEYKELAKTFRFKLLGATKAKFIEKFAKRTKKLPQRCSRGCNARVERLERSLRLKEVTTNTSQCMKGEMKFI